MTSCALTWPVTAIIFTTNTTHQRCVIYHGKRDCLDILLSGNLCVLSDSPLQYARYVQPMLVLMLGQRRRRWLNVKPALGKGVVLRSGSATKAQNVGPKFFQWCECWEVFQPKCIIYYENATCRGEAGKWGPVGKGGHQWYFNYEVLYEISMMS